MQTPSLNWFVEAVKGGSRHGLAKAITLVESHHPEHRRLAGELLSALGPPPEDTRRIGLSGVPGVGKSTFIESFGLFLIEKGHRVAVLSVDPTSPLSGGSILGDKTRMPQLSNHPQAFIRPSPSGGALGGVAWRTRETQHLLEAAGYDTVLVETVGVGQSETDVADMTDFFLLLMLAGAGDELQGMKKGILELADAMVINKVDDVGKAAALRARADIESALGLTPQSDRPGALAGWRAPVLLASGLTGEGLAEIHDVIERHQRQAAETGAKARRRRHQNLAWFHRLLQEELMVRLRSHAGVGKIWPAVEADVEAGNLGVQEAVARVLAFL